MESRSTATAKHDDCSHRLTNRSNWGDMAGTIAGTFLSLGSPQQAGIGRWSRSGFSGRCRGSNLLRALQPPRCLRPSPPAYGGTPHSHPPWPLCTTPAAALRTLLCWSGPTLQPLVGRGVLPSCISTAPAPAAQLGPGGGHGGGLSLVPWGTGCREGGGARGVARSGFAVWLRRSGRADLFPGF